MTKADDKLDKKMRIDTIGIRLAHQHWCFVDRWLEIIYKDAFIHGFGHGVEEADKKREE